MNRLLSKTICHLSIREHLYSILFLHETPHTTNCLLVIDRHDCSSDQYSETMFLVRISNELQIAIFNCQLSDLISQYSAINLMGDLMDN